MLGSGAPSGWCGRGLRFNAAASTNCATSNVNLRSTRADIRDDFHRIVYAANGDAARIAYAPFERTWAKHCSGVVTSLREGGDELLTFFRLPKAQWKALRSTNVIERLHEEFRRRVKTQGSLPSEDAALVLLFSLVASGQIKLRRIDGWRKIAGHHHVVVDGLRQGLREVGLEEGKQLVLDIREIEGDPSVAEQAARDLERGKVDLIYTVTSQVTIAARRATARTPIVFYVGADPVALGLVESPAKPGGRLTGVHGLTRDITAKRLAVLKKMIPRLRRVVTFYNLGEPLSRENARLGRDAARQLGVQVVERHVASIEELRLKLQGLKSREVDAYFYTPGLLETSQALLIIEATRRKKLPTMFHEQSLVGKGALASYGTNYQEIGRLSAKHVQRILSGSHPKNLPVENYDKVGFALNLRIAREIGLTIPQSLRLQADQIIE